MTAKSLVDVLLRRAAEMPDVPAYHFLNDDLAVSDSLSYRQLDDRAAQWAAALRQTADGQTQHVLLAFEPGLDFIAAFFGCLYAGLIAVPTYPPARRTLERFQCIAVSCGATVVAYDGVQVEAWQRLGRDKALGKLLRVEPPSGPRRWRPALGETSTVRPAFLQFTSGSTSAPKGVIITELTLRLHPLPEGVSAARCGFPSLQTAIDTVIQVIQTGIPIGRIEFLDELQVAACNRYSKLNLPEVPTLFFEFQGSPASLAEQVEMVEAIARDNGGSGYAWATTPEARSQLRQARHDVWWAALALRPGCQGIPTDACVPISMLGDAAVAARQDVLEFGLTAPMCGHVGDGHIFPHARAQHVQALKTPAPRRR